MSMDTSEIVKSIMRSGKLYSLDNYDERLAYAIFMADRVEKSLYDILTNGGIINLSPDDFHAFVGSDKGIKDAAGVVMVQAVDNFDHDSYFNFIDPNPVLPDDYEEDDDDSSEGKEEEIYRAYAFLPFDRAVALVDKLFFNAEVLFYLEQLNSGKTYAWEDFLEEMAADRAMWHKLVLAFRDAVMRIDYTPYWQKFIDGSIRDLYDGGKND